MNSISIIVGYKLNNVLKNYISDRFTNRNCLDITTTQQHADNMQAILVEFLSSNNLIIVKGTQSALHSNGNFDIVTLKD